MLDSTAILQDVEELLNDHFGQLQTTWQQQEAQQTALPAIPATQSTSIPPSHATTTPITDFVTNVIMLLMFSALEKRLST